MKKCKRFLNIKEKSLFLAVFFDKKILQINGLWLFVPCLSFFVPKSS